MKNIILNRKQIFSISLLIILLDQSIKYWVSFYIGFNTATIFWPGIINLHVVRNTGAAFSLFSESTFILGVISFLVSTILILFTWKRSQLLLWKGLGIAFLLGGSLGNGLDRWRLNYVIDFIEIVPFDFPIFNIADISINFAVVFLILDSIYRSVISNDS